ncbi:FGGY family carbohydrate kinase [Draconibacterium sp. IB214405]|uniref:FGGY-family carbohydrate kinase n=1 Tax=Draconibacterium sp. IB214405 TaxID=3097352 RepID=UPI002A0F724C|nr:FGGY family carbohydrate kinase [Draconibacterium sp. IB214405]MDX8338888.1 FGGY family carbohydrate kinase [Draconibacterium sp. IB214405]
MTEVIAVFDIGKTNKKILLFDSNFKVVKQHEEKFPVITDDDGFECDDIDLIKSWISKSLEEIVTGNEYDLKGVNFSTYGASLMFLDDNGQRLTPVYNYLKEIPETIAVGLFEQYGGKNEFCRKTASPALGLLLNSGIQILWMKDQKTAVYEKAKSVLHFPQYLSYTLSKEIVSEPTSIGCHTFMWDFDQMKYHQWIPDNEIALPEPINNDVVFSADVAGKEVKVGTGIHDSSASLVPYLKASPAKFILVSTGTWCINMNPYNEEPLTASELEQDCLCFLTPNKEQVKSSRLFMGHFHEVWAEKLAKYFNVAQDSFKKVKNDQELVDSLLNKYGEDSVYFSNGKESFDEGLKVVDLSVFPNYEEAYTKLMIDLTALCITSINLVVPEIDDTKILYISGGFARNPIFIELLKKSFPAKKVLISEIDNSSALGAAMVISDTLSEADVAKLDLGIQE